MAELGKGSGPTFPTPCPGSPVLCSLYFSALPRDAYTTKSLSGWIPGRHTVHSVKSPLPRGALVFPRFTGSRHLDEAGGCHLRAVLRTAISP